MDSSLVEKFRFRDLDAVKERWVELARYEAEISARLPPGAKELVLAKWHYDGSDPRCPHDSWIQSIEIQTDDSKLQIRGIRLRLLGAYHDRIILIDYAGVRSFSIEGSIVTPDGRNLDWLYDEVHLCDSGFVEHIIEFEESVLRIECSDFAISYATVDDAESTEKETL